MVEVDNSTLVRLQLWDIAGQERFGSMTRVYYRDADAAVIMFDLTAQRTFEAVAKWKLRRCNVVLSVFLKAVCVRIAGKVQPHRRPPFTKVRRGQQGIYEHFVCPDAVFTL